MNRPSPEDSSKTLSLTQHVRSDPIMSALQHREWTLYAQPRGYDRHILLLKSGRAEITRGNLVTALEGPSITWLYASDDLTLKIRAGTSGHLLGMSYDILAGGFGLHAESANLRYMIDQTFTLSLGEREQDALEYSCEAIDYEIRHGGHASWMILGAHIRLISAEIWRLSGAEAIAHQSQGGVSPILQRFRQLLEVNFRHHWSIRQYAEAINISHDRLHAICKRKLGRSPLQLVHERLCHEGQHLLEHSTLTVEQIALSLGFKDASHFSHFFKRRTAFSPSRYRQLALDETADRGHASSANFADWP